MQIQQIYEELKEWQLCKSGYAFSRDYLKKDRSYYSVLKAREKEPSMEAWVMLDYSLQQRAQVFGDSKIQQVREAGTKLNRLHTEVWSHILKKCASNFR